MGEYHVQVMNIGPFKELQISVRNEGLFLNATPKMTIFPISPNFTSNLHFLAEFRKKQKIRRKRILRHPKVNLPKTSADCCSGHCGGKTILRF